MAAAMENTNMRKKEHNNWG